MADSRVFVIYSCHPHYLSPRAHAKLARPTAFDGLRIHTDEIEEVITRMAPSSLDHAIVRLANGPQIPPHPLSILTRPDFPTDHG